MEVPSAKPISVLVAENSTDVIFLLQGMLIFHKTLWGIEYPLNSCSEIGINMVFNFSPTPILSLSEIL